MPKIKRLSAKERKTLNLMKNKGMELDDAVRESYDVHSEGGVRSLSSKLVHRKRFIALMDKFGLSDEAIVKELASGIHAMKPVVVGPMTVKKFKDYQARLGFLKVALKVKRLLDEDKEQEKEGEPLIINAIQINTTTKAIRTNTKPIIGEIVKSDNDDKQS